MGEASSVAVLPRRSAPLVPGSIPRPGAVHAFGFQSILASAGFFPGFYGFLPALLDFLNKFISEIIWSNSASADDMALRLQVCRALQKHKFIYLFIKECRFGVFKITKLYDINIILIRIISKSSIFMHFDMQRIGLR